MKRMTRRALRRCEGQGNFCLRPSLYRCLCGPVSQDREHTLCFRCYRALRNRLRIPTTLAG
jgi:hypothetical protein